MDETARRPPLLVLDNVVKEYDRGLVTRVLHGISLTLEGGSFTAIIGPSGSGKSTLLNTIGLLDRPTSGGLRFLGTDVLALKPREVTAFRGRKIGFVFQFHHLLSGFTAAENVTLPLMASAGRSRPEMRPLALAVLARMGLSDKADAPVTQLSGGEQQRVAIARALVASPPLLLADEPTGNLDTKNADEVFALLRDLQRERGLAVLVVTHDRRLAERCDRIIEIVDGLIASDRKMPR
jgi:lipoprotein-releasing system ATP-binding protein